MTMDFTGASVNRAGGLSAADERPLSINAQASAVRFEIDLQAAQLDSAPGGLGMSPPDDSLDDQEASDISEDPSPAEQMMWLGVTLPLPIELRPDNTAAGTEDDSTPRVPSDSKRMSRAELTHWIELRPDNTAAGTEDGSTLRVPSDSKRMSRAELPHWIEVGLAPVGEPREELSADPRSVSIDPVTVDGPTLDPGRRSTPDPMSPATVSSSSTMDERLLADSSLDDIHLPLSDQTPAPPTVDEEPISFDAPAPDAENTAPVDRPTGFVSVPPNDIHTNIPHAATQSSHSPRGIPVEPRTELSEVVRQVRTMVTEHETRSTIQLEPAELGRLTLELVDAPEGLRAYVSAEDPAVLRFLERNVQLLETEARLHGVGPMSFSVGANVSGGLGGGDQRQSEAEASFRKNIEWNTAPHAKPRSRRELDTNA